MMPVKNVSRGWWFAFVVLAVLGGVVGQHEALANPSPSATANCAAGRNCRARSFTSTGGNGTIEYQLSQLAFMFLGPICSLRPNSSNMTFGGPCNWGFSSTGGSAQFLAGGGLYFTTQTLVTSFTNPTTLTGAATLMADTTTARLWRSNGATYTEVGGGPHPVMEGNAYVYKSDLGTSGAPTWNFPPRVNGADVAFATAGTQTVANSQTTYTTTAIAGNQAHHSTGAFHGRGVRWAGRVFINPAVTTQRAFFGFSDTRPLTAGSDTPTASAAVFRYVTALSANWFACTASAAALDCVDTGVAVQNADVTLQVDCREVVACTFWIDGRAYVRKTTNLPGGGVTYGSTISTETRDANAKLFGLNRVSIETAQ